MFHLGYILFTTKGRQSQLDVHLILKILHTMSNVAKNLMFLFPFFNNIAYPFFSFPMHSKVFDPIVIHFAVKRCR